MRNFSINCCVCAASMLMEYLNVYNGFGQGETFLTRRANCVNAYIVIRTLIMHIVGTDS